MKKILTLLFISMVFYACSQDATIEVISHDYSYLKTMQGRSFNQDEKEILKVTDKALSLEYETDGIIKEYQVNREKLKEASIFERDSLKQALDADFSKTIRNLATANFPYIRGTSRIKRFKKYSLYGENIGIYEAGIDSLLQSSKRANPEMSEEKIDSIIHYYTSFEIEGDFKVLFGGWKSDNEYVPEDQSLTIYGDTCAFFYNARSLKLDNSSANDTYITISFLFKKINSKWEVIDALISPSTRKIFTDYSSMMRVVENIFKVPHLELVKIERDFYLALEKEKDKEKRKELTSEMEKLYREYY